MVTLCLFACAWFILHPNRWGRSFAELWQLRSNTTNALSALCRISCFLPDFNIFSFLTNRHSFLAFWYSGSCVICCTWVLMAWTNIDYICRSSCILYKVTDFLLTICKMFIWMIHRGIRYNASFLKILGLLLSFFILLQKVTITGFCLFVRSFVFWSAGRLEWLNCRTSCHLCWSYSWSLRCSFLLLVPH